MLVDMIKANDIPTLWEYELPSYLGFMKDLVKEYLPQIFEQLTVDNVIDYAKKYDRDDLARILVHKKAREWMRRFLNKIRFMLEHIDLKPYEIQAAYEDRLRELKSKRDEAQAKQVAAMLAQQQAELEANALEQPEIVNNPPLPKIEKLEVPDFDEGITEEELLAAMGKKKMDDKFDIDFGSM